MPEELSFNESSFIENKIFTIRGVPVMLDRDLAELYQVETKALNQSVKRNIERFPNWTMFQINIDEYNVSRSQIVTLNKRGRGQNLKYLPYAFTEQGVAMLSAILKSDIAIKVSLQIMEVFVSMRKSGLILSKFENRIELVEKKQIEFDLKIDKVFTALENAAPIPNQGIFFNGQIFDAYKFVSDIIRSAKQSIILIDNYTDENTLALLSKRGKNVEAIVYSEKSNPILKNDFAKFAEQYPPVKFLTLKNNHDRFLIIDKKEMYHIGASLKDLGKKLFAFSRMDAETKRLLDVVGG